MSEKPAPVVSYSVTIARVENGLVADSVQYDGYGLLQELLDDIVDEVSKRDWFKDEEQAA